MDFLSELGGSFLFYLAFFVLVAIVAVVYRTIRQKNKEKGFRGYLSENFPNLGEDEPMLMAKSKSKQAKPDRALVIDEDNQEVIILKNDSGKQITQYTYPLSDLVSVTRTDQMISRGFAPKTWSYEENLDVVFKDGVHHQFYLENISNRHGTDSGADAVRRMFDPWYEKLAVNLSSKAG